MSPHSLCPAFPTVGKVFNGKLIEVSLNRLDIRRIELNRPTEKFSFINRLHNIKSFHTLRADIVKFSEDRAAILRIFNQPGISPDVEHPVARGGSNLTQKTFSLEKLMTAEPPFECSVDENPHKTLAFSEDSQNGKM